MDASKFMIVLKGKIRTVDVKSCVFNAHTRKYDLVFQNNKKYSYLPSNVIFMSNPITINPSGYKIVTREGKWLYGAKWVYEFNNRGEKYWHIVFEGFYLDYKKNDLQIIENNLNQKQSKCVFDYLKEVAALSQIPNDNGEIILKKYYEKIGFLPENRALSVYLNPNKKIETRVNQETIFPFGCNQSQYKAVKNALDNQISIIQGPPGTGKTQTILNIIANLIVQGKSVLVVSTNFLLLYELILF